MSKLPGKGIQKVINKYIRYSSPHDVIRFGDRLKQRYNKRGYPVPVTQTAGTIKLHHQPAGDGTLIKDLKEGQRLQDMKKGWTAEEIREKDRVKIDGVWFTVNAVQIWPGQTGHKELDLLRTGEQDNL